ncbi:WD40 repeat-like protein [Athelia psychrophila]|uniref:WD40 repeat-like protein n=1 Tax=Athelia psychrophila TaxID=1759441 RepID=A0A166JT98_9AGAM|nr:WD40 repeat-like protein [Fibularhizoctonia sp. CBS 109695]
MRDAEADQGPAAAAATASPRAGPSSLGAAANGHNGSGFAPAKLNGVASNGHGGPKHANAHARGVARVELPGTALYADEAYVSREEFVRVVLQSLRDVGYMESAATLEAESGYTMEAPIVSQFRRYILEAAWPRAEDALVKLGLTDADGLWEAKFLIHRQKYLELLEAGRTTTALTVLRNELAPLDFDQDQLHFLSSLLMCADPADLHERAGWDGASGASRHELLTALQSYIPASTMIPRHRLSTLLTQAQTYQLQQCTYHNAAPPLDSLYADHACDRAAFPGTTTASLEVHTDEVWNIEWSHDGLWLASASRDKTAIIWRVGPETPSTREYTPTHILRQHAYPISCLAWSMDDAILLTGAETEIRMWNTKTGECIRTLEDGKDGQVSRGHVETVTAISWIPDGSGFVSGGLDKKIILWDANGSFQHSWGTTAMRITDLTVTPDLARVVAVGIHYHPPSPVVGVVNTVADTPAPPDESSSSLNLARKPENNCMIVYDLATRQTEMSFPMEGELSSVKVSPDSRYALVNHPQDEIYLWDLLTGKLARKFAGQRQHKHVIRSCFGGIDGNFVVSGSEDGNVYVWHRDTGALLETLSGHGEGSVNSVAWNPKNVRMFASCSDDHTIRIWEAPPTGHVLGAERIDPESNGSGKGKTRQRPAASASNGEGGMEYGRGS